MTLVEVQQAKYLVLKIRKAQSQVIPGRSRTREQGAAGDAPRQELERCANHRLIADDGIPLGGLAHKSGREGFGRRLDMTGGGFDGKGSMIAAHDDLRLEDRRDCRRRTRARRSAAVRSAAGHRAGRTSRATLDRENGVAESHGTGTLPRPEIVENMDIRKQKKRRPSVG